MNKGPKGLARLINSRKDALTGLLLFFAALMIRLPFRSHTLYEWDSVNFANAMDRFNVPADRPHPPGYILYVGLGRLFRLFFENANTALVALSILSGAFAILFIYLIGRDIFNFRTGFLASLLFLFSPLIWIQSEVALSYIVELPLALVATWLIYQLFFFKRYAVLTAVLIGFAGGLRQDVLLFLGPLWFIGAARLGFRTLLLSGAALIGSVLVWVFPLLYSSGGIVPYREASSMQFNEAVYPLSVFASGLHGLHYNLKEILQALYWFLGGACLLLIFTAFSLLKPGGMLSDRRVIFLLSVPVPAIIYFTFLNFSNPAYLFVFAGPIVLLLARSLDMFTFREDEPGNSYWASERRLKNLFKIGIMSVIFALISALSTFLYFNVDTINIRLPFTDMPMASIYTPYSNSYLVEQDGKVGASASAVNVFDPVETLVVVSPGSANIGWRPLSYYISNFRMIVLLGDNEAPGYRTTQYGEHKWVKDSHTIPVPSEVKQVVFIGVRQSETIIQMTPLPGDSAQFPMNRAAWPDTSSLTVGAYELQK